MFLIHTIPAETPIIHIGSIVKNMLNSKLNILSETYTIASDTDTTKTWNNDLEFSDSDKISRIRPIKNSQFSENLAKVFIPIK